MPDNNSPWNWTEGREHLRQLMQLDSGIRVEEVTAGASKRGTGTRWPRYQLFVGDRAVSKYMTQPEIAAYTAGYLAARGLS